MKKVVEKWLPVLQSLNISKDHYEFVSSYAEQHHNFEKKTGYLNGEETLPLALKIIQKLLFDGVVLELSTKNLGKEFLFSSKIESEVSLSPEHYEHLAISEVVKILSKKGNKIFVYIMLDIKPIQSTRVVKFYSNIKIVNREDKLKRILKYEN